jgi:hypothetical protein
MPWSPDGIRNLEDENDVRERLTEWIEDSGGVVYWGEQPEEYSQTTFSVTSQSGLSDFSGGDSSSQSERPDMLVVWNDHVSVVEVKAGNRYGQTIDGAYELFEYWENYEQGRSSYEVGDEEYTPDSFLLATRCSPFGHIFPPEHEFLYENEGVNFVNERIPRFEANMAGVFTRLLWRFTREEGDQDSAIGLMLSSCLEDISDEEAEFDDHGMARASRSETVGSPATFTHTGSNQEWTVLSSD